jgi:hypothetical protein
VRPLVLLCALAVVFYLPPLLGGTVQFDGVDVHFSAQRYLSDELHAGRLPFWTPYIFGGFPFLADVQVGAWYPLHWPFLLFGITPASLTGELLLHTIVACSGAYMLGVRLLGERSAAFGVALFYGLSGWFAAHSQHIGMFLVAAWLPWLMILLDRARHGLTVRRLALAGLLGAALALPGHFQTALYAFCFSALWAALQALAGRARSQVVGVLVTVTAVGVWGGLLAAVMVLPGLELVSQSVRQTVNARASTLGFFQPEALLTLVQPDHYGLLSGHYVGPGDSTQHYFYAGLLLAPLALLGARNTRILRSAAFLGLPFLWYALGPSGGLFQVVARLPGFRSVELPMHGWFLPALGLALLGGAGLSRLPARVRPVLLGLVFLDALLVNQLSNPLAYARATFDALYGQPLAAFARQVAQAEPAVERVYGPPMAAIGYRNHALQSRVATTYGYNPLELSAYTAYAEAAEANPRLVDGLAASHRLVDGVLEPNPGNLPVAYFARQIWLVPDEPAADAALATLDPTRATLVIGSTPPPIAEPDERASVTIVDRAADRLTLHYRTATQSLLRLAMPTYSGWHARLAGRELTTLTVDRAFIGALVPSGEGDITVSYEPRWFWPGLAISSLALTACLIALGGGLSRPVGRAVRRAIRPAR